MYAADDLFFEFVAADPMSLSGSSVGSFMTALVERFDSSWVIVRDLQGSGENLAELSEAASGAKVLSTEEFLAWVPGATQYDWAFFHLYKESPPSIDDTADDGEIIRAADVTVRLADDKYFYVYSADIRICDFMKGMFKKLDERRVRIDELAIPY